MIQRSEANVRHLLGQSAEYIFEKGHGQQTPLHVATWWPPGLEILFELANEACVSILDATDNLGLTPLQYAISWPQPKSVALLLKENATLDFEDSSAYSPGNFAGDLGQHNKEVCRLLVAALLDRRTKMLQYALEHLPESEVVRFDLRNTSFLNGIAFEVGESIKLHTTRLPEIFKDVRPGSIYHWRYMGGILAETLFEAGFDDVHSRWNGCTPLMIHHFRDTNHAVSLINWYYQQQADFLAVIPNALLLPPAICSPGPLKFRLIHRLASVLGDTTIGEWRQHHYWPGQRSHYLSLMRKIIAVSLRDPCQCYCAPDGCDSTSLYAKKWARCHFRRPSDLSRLSCGLDMALDLMSVQEEDVQFTFIRVCTFERLGMRHTCCEYDFLILLEHDNRLHPHIKTMDHMEVEEIQAEDDFLAKTLEGLMAEFKSRFRNETQSFRDFWKWWDERMDEIDAARDPIPVEDIEAMINIGVCLEA